MAHGESQVRTFVDGHTEYASHAFEGSQQVHGTRAETGQHGPNLKEEYTHETPSLKPWQPQTDFSDVHAKIPAAVASHRLWLQVSVLLAPIHQL